MRVLCLEPRETMPPIVGESLDWSAPKLLAALGLPIHALVDEGVATWKCHITFHLLSGERREYAPGPWLAKPPWNVNLHTLHLDRPQVHSAMEEMARRLGVTTIRQRAVGFETQGKRLIAVHTDRGLRIQAARFVDASGAASSVLGRQFHLPSHTDGPRKVALWAHVPVHHQAEGTNLHMCSRPSRYMEWIWEIPVRPGVSSVGYVLPGSHMKTKRASGLTNADIFEQAVGGFERLRSGADMSAVKPTSTSFRCRTYLSACGPNWIIVGEAAAQTDPITGNGVTAALRHAAEGSEMLLRCRTNRAIPLFARRAYSLRVSQLGRFFNSLIEALFYQPGLRSCVGEFAVGRIYTIPAWLTNLLYSRVEPRRLSTSILFTCLLAGLRGAARVTQLISNVVGSHSPRASLVRGDVAAG